jgi:hypothetical protein
VTIAMDPSSSPVAFGDHVNAAAVSLEPLRDPDRPLIVGSLVAGTAALAAVMAGLALVFGW